MDDDNNTNSGNTDTNSGNTNTDTNSERGLARGGRLSLRFTRACSL